MSSDKILTILRKVAKSPSQHTIAKGDSFWDLDKLYKLRSGSFQKANPTVNPKRLRIGDKLIIPDRVDPATSAAAAGTRATPNPVVAPAMPSADIPDPNAHAMRKFYNAITRAETGSYKDKWIRTHGVPGVSSSAWGPAQLTKTKLADYMDRFPKRMRAHKNFYESVMLPMYDNFLKYGREPKKAGYDKRWDYGGYGVRLTPQQQAQYENMVMDLMAIDRAEVDRL
jgi:LysM repeat protein